MTGMRGGKVAVITGSDSCIGLAEPLEFAREGTMW